MGELTIAFVADWDGDEEVYAVQADGSGLVQITHNAIIDSAPKWSPDGEHLAFIDDLIWRPRLIVADPDGSHASMVPFDREVFFDLVWSPTGQEIALLSGSELFSVDVESGEGIALTRGAGFELELPSFSPDGDRMAFAAGMPAEAGRPYSRLFTVTARGTELTELSFRFGDATWPDWHPLRDEIIFQGVVGEDVGLYVATPDGSIRRLRARPEDSGYLPSWSPDGTMIAYVVGGAEPGVGGRPLDSLHVATANEEVDELVLRPEVGGDRGLGIYRYYWAPDSRHIAYMASKALEGTTDVDVYVFDICEGIPRMVVEDLDGFPDLSWRPLP